METVTDFMFLGSKITADRDCSHEIKRCLLFGRKAMTNLDSILKSRDIALPACRQHWSTEWAQISMKKPNSMFHKQRFKSWMNWAMQFCLIGHIHLTSCQPATTSSSISTNFCRENVSTTSMRKKNAFQEFLESWSTNFYATGINKLISYWQKCVDLNSSYFS